MSELRSFVALQARLYEFLEQQDELTLRAIISGTAELTVLRESAPRPPAASRPSKPSSEPEQIAEALTKLPSGDERRAYLDSVNLDKKKLQAVAKSLNVRRYSHLAKDDLVDLLAGHGSNHGNSVSEPRPTAPALQGPVGDSLGAGAAEAARPPTEIARSDVDVVAFAARLRETETEEEGAAYLREQHLDRETLLAVAAELQLTRVTRLSQSELEKRVLKQAIGARRKFAGLRKW